MKENKYSFFLAIIIFFFDRISKHIIFKLSEPLGELQIMITSNLNFNLLWNKGIAFGLFSFKEDIYYNSLTGIIIAITFVILLLMIKSKGIEKLGFTFVLGGSLGNIYDRLYHSAVIDFIDFHFNNHHWFVFNIADIFITLGIVSLIYVEFFYKNKPINNE
jgi:signal peptidase II